MIFFAGFQPCDLVALELPFLLIPTGIGLLLLYYSRRSPSAINISKIALLLVSAVILTILLPLELYLFNGERFNISSEQVASIHGKLWTALIFMWPVLWFICRLAIKNFQAERLINTRKWCLRVTGAISIIVGLSFALASSCIGLG